MKQTFVLLTAVVLTTHCSTVFSSNFILNRRSTVNDAELDANTLTNVITSSDGYGSQYAAGIGYCNIDPNNKSVTIHNLKYNCNYRQLRSIFYNLAPGTFPNGRLKGYTIVGPDALIEVIWNGKNFYYTPGAVHGTVTNTFLGIFQFLRATIYRTIAPIDGREAFAIDYRNEIFAFVMIDFLRNVQDNLYLGFVAIRGFEKIPIGYFLLESV